MLYQNCDKMDHALTTPISIDGSDADGEWKREKPMTSREHHMPPLVS